MSALPANVGVCGIKGKFVASRLVPGDADGVLDVFAIQGLRVTLTPSPPYLKNKTSAPPQQIVAEPMVMETDATGVLRDVTGRDVMWVIATDDPDLDPVNWTYTVSFQGTNASSFRPFSIAAPQGQTLDLALITPSPAALGVSVSVAQAAEAAAAAYASQAAASAASVGPAVTDAVTKADTALSAAQVATTAANAAAPKTARYLAGTGIGNEAPTIQAVLDAAGSDEIVRLYGTFTTASTITVKGNLDASGAVVNYSGTGVAVQVGVTGSPTFRKTVTLPRVVHTGKTGVGWATVAGTTGVLILNWYSGQVMVPHVQSFETGLTVRGAARGCVYSNITIGHLDNNKVNQLVAADATGWSNQQVFIGGRFSHNSSEGSAVSDTRHIGMTTGLPNPPNNNLWINPSLEGDTAEYHVELAGTNNQFLNTRWEVTGGARVWLRADARDNQILWGYGSFTLAVTREIGELRNQILTSRYWEVPVTGKGVVIENTGSSSDPALSVMAAGGISSGADQTTDWRVKIAAQYSDFKRSTDANPRVRVDGENGRLWLGPGGATALARYLANLGSSAISVNGGNLVPGTNNALDLGQASFLWRYIRAATALQTGAFATADRPAAATAGAGAHVLDTDLGRPVWSNGSAWQDPIGAAAAAANPGGWVPADHGLIACDVDPALSGSSYTLAAAGVLYLRKIKMSAASAITNVMLYINTAGAAVSNAYVAVYDSTGAQLGVSADVSTALQSTGTKTIPLTAATGVRAAGSWVYIGIVVGAATTLPALRGFAQSIHTFGLTAGALYRWGSTGSGLTAAPASFTPSMIASVGSAMPIVGLT